MEYTIEVLVDPPALAITSSGSAVVDDFLDIETFLADPRVKKGLPILADHSQLDVSGLSTGDIREIAHGYRELLDALGETPVAIVVSEMEAFGLARMAEIYAGAPPPRQRVFYTRDAALEWLRLGAPALS
jgi:hypothetical protein